MLDNNTDHVVILSCVDVTVAVGLGWRIDLLDIHKLEH
jgi:hypothetical protein